MTRREDKETRSKIMASVRSENTKIELIMEGILVKTGVAFEKHPHEILGKPDFAIRDRKILIFCDGDFWHGYDFENNPRLNVKNNREFWMKKIRRNMERDNEVNRALKEDGWKVLRFWEHQLEKEPGMCESILSQGLL